MNIIKKVSKIISLLLIPVYCVFSQEFKDIIENIRYDLSLRDSIALVAIDSLFHVDIHTKSIKPKTTVNLLSDICYEGEISSPLNSTKFCLFSINSIEPSSYIAYSVSGKEYREFPTDSLVYDFCNSAIIDHINSLLINERILRKKELVDLVVLFNSLTSPGYGFNRLLCSWTDIELQPKEIIPKNVKRIIKPPYVKEELDISYVTFYVWDMGSTILRKIMLTYKSKKINIDSKLIGKYGEPHIIL